MRGRKASALALALLMAIVPSAMLVSAAEEPAVPIPTTPADPTIDYAIAFADNMAFTPQWRVGNLVRIEIMVLEAYDTNGDGMTTAADVPLNVNLGYTQADLMADPTLILTTWMVSVPQISVDISGAGYAESFYSDFTDGVSDADTVGREINKVGHLIYGFLWDTTNAPEGTYRVSVDIPDGYDVELAIRSLVAEDGTVLGYEELPADAGVSGTGGVDQLANAGYIYIGQLIAKGGSGGGGGNGGGGHGRK